MKESVILKIIAEICLFFAFVSLFNQINANALLISLFVVSLLICGMIAVKFKNIVFRILISLLPLITYLFVKDYLVAIFIGLAYLYYLLIIILGRFSIEYITYKSLFTFEIIAIIAYLLILFAGSYIDSYIKDGIIIFAMAFFVLGISSLRLVRMQEYSNVKWRILNIGVIVLVSALSISFFYLIHLGILNSRVIFETLFYPFVWLISSISSLLGKIFSPNHVDEESTISESFEISEEIIESDLPQVEYKKSLVQKFYDTEFNIPWDKIFFVLLIILIICLIFALVKKLSKKEKKALQYSVSNEIYKEEKKKKTKVIKDSAYQVRIIYKKYLYYLRNKGITIIEGNTSNEILVNSKKVTTSIYANRLRDIYIKARYDVNAVDEYDVMNAKKCYDAIIKNLEDDSSLLNK